MVGIGSDEAKLQRAFGFTDDDLAANRDGCLSSAQKRRLWRRFFWNIALMGTIVLLLVILGVVALFVRLVIVTLFAWGIAAMPGYLLWRQYRNTRDTMQLAGVDHVSGPAHLGHRRQSTGDVYVRSSVHRLTIHNMAFDLTRAQWKALQNGEVYTVYYVHGLGVIIAVEKHGSSMFSFT